MRNLSACLFFFILSLRGISQNPLLTDPGFESLTPGANPSTAWISWVGGVTGPSPHCNGFTSYTLNNSTSIVATTPLIDPRCSNVSNSPFSGNKVIILNQTPINGVTTTRTKLRQSFQVTNTGFIYRYAYKGVLDANHATCDAGSLLFNFYDCNGNLISAISRTIVATMNNFMNPDAASWALAPATNAASFNNYGIAYTPNWVMHSVNLIPYIGTCVTVEVIASPCNCTAWPGYCYYDSECTDNFIETSGYTFLGTNGYTACEPTTGLSGTPGFSSYLWQGPVNSGISNATSQAIGASVSGGYSLAVTLGTVSLSKAINVTMGASVPVVSLTSSSPSVCLGGSVTLQASGSALTYTWSTTSNAAFISVSPTVTTVYSVLATNSFGCMASDTKSIYMAPSPQLVQIGSQVSNICPGQSAMLNAVGNANTSYTWSTGSNNQSLSVSPSATTLYSVSATNTLGCVSMATKLISLYPLTPIQINVSNSTICANQPVNLSLAGQGITTYTWSTGLTNQVLSVTPAVTSVYSLVGTDLNGCNSPLAIATINVLPLPALQVTASSNAVCLGQSVNLTAISSPNYLYSWSNGYTTNSSSATPQVNTVYHVIVSDAMGCSSTASIAITVMPLPQVSIQSLKDAVCEGESLTLSAVGTGLTAYSWNTGGTSQSIIVSPLSSPTFYNVTGTDNNGCSSVSQKMVDVFYCAGLKSYAITQTSLLVFPNPTNSEFTIKGSKDERGIIINALGQQVKTFDLQAGNNFSQSFNGFAAGIYFVKTAGGSTKVIVK